MDYSVFKYYLLCFLVLTHCNFGAAHHLPVDEHLAHHGFWGLLLILISVIFSALSVWSAKFLVNANKNCAQTHTPKKEAQNND